MKQRLKWINIQRFRALVRAFLIASTVGWIWVGVAQAAVLTVINENDAGQGSLRVELALAEAGDEIKFSNDVRKIVLTSGPLVIDRSLTITGPGQGQLTIDGARKHTVFRTFAKDGNPRPAVSITISGLTITRGGALLFSMSGS